MKESISGFSKLTKVEKINWLTRTYLKNDPKAVEVLKQYWQRPGLLATKAALALPFFPSKTVSVCGMTTVNCQAVEAVISQNV